MTGKNNFICIMLLTVMLAIASLQAASGADQSVKVQTLVEKQAVTVGESFVMQIKVDGDDSPAEPDLSGLNDFTVQPKGGGQNNRQSLTIINGKVNRISERGYIFQYLLTPRRDGMLTIPAIAIRAGGKSLYTQPVTIRVSQPLASDEFELRLALSQKEAYVGQPLILTVKWFVNADIAEFTFDLPFLDDKKFIIADHPEDINYQGQDGISINLPGGPVIARKGRENLYDQQYTAVTLRKIFIPREPGEFSLGPGTVFSKIITGYKQKRPGQPFDDFFNRDLLGDVFGRRQAVYKQLVTESNDLTITVLPLPEENRLPDFSGLVGQFSLAAEAGPTEVNVGDPITLQILVTGGEYLDNVVLPPLTNQQSIRDNFKVPEEMGPGEIDGRVKTFTQTIRARHPAVKEIPAISLNYFNPVTEQYESAATHAIPLQVNITKIVTAMDAEGRVAAGKANTELTSLHKGIAHNYVGADILENQEVEIASWFNAPHGVALVLFPPGAYLLVLVYTYMRRKHLLDADFMQAQKALPEFAGDIKRLQMEISRCELQQTVNGLADAIRNYLRKRLHLPPGGLVYTEAAERIQHEGLDTRLLGELIKIMDLCETYRYGAVINSGAGRENILKMLSDTLTLFEEIDQFLKKRPGRAK